MVVLLCFGSLYSWNSATLDALVLLFFALLVLVAWERFIARRVEGMQQ